MVELGTIRLSMNFNGILPSPKLHGWLERSEGKATQDGYRRGQAQHVREGHVVETLSRKKGAFASAGGLTNAFKVPIDKLIDRKHDTYSAYILHICQLWKRSVKVCAEKLM